MVRSAARPRVSNHLAVNGLAAILRDAAKTPLLRMRSTIYSQAFGSRRNELEETPRQQTAVSRGEARKNRLLCTVDAAADEKGGARRVPRLECLDDVVASVRRALGELPACVRDCAAELDLQRKPRQRFDQRRISGLLGNIFVELPIAHLIGLDISTPQCGNGFGQ